MFQLFHDPGLAIWIGQVYEMYTELPSMIGFSKAQFRCRASAVLN